MATNPNNAVGTNGAFGGRTSVNAFNDVLSICNSRGIVQGWDMAPDSGMDITIGGDGSNRDVAIAQDNIGNKTTINNISEQPIPLTIPAAPATNSRIDAVVAYVDNPAEGSATATDNYGACGLIVVSGSAASSPVAPNEADIRTAITADGGAGSVAYYVVLGTVRVATGTTDISANMLTKGAYSGVTSDNIDWTTIGSRESSTSTSVTSSGTSWTNAGPNITVGTAGKYLFLGTVPVAANATSNQHVLARIFNSSANTTIGAISDFFGISVGVPTGFSTLNVYGIATVNANAVIRLQFRTPNQSGGARTDNENGNQSSLICIRIGSANA